MFAPFPWSGEPCDRLVNVQGHFITNIGKISRKKWKVLPQVRENEGVMQKISASRPKFRE